MREERVGGGAETLISLSVGVKQRSNSGQKVVKQWSNSGQKVVKQWSNSDQKVVKQWSNSDQKVVKQWSNSGRTDPGWRVQERTGCLTAV